MNAANEIAVAAFLQDQIAFPRIWETVEKTMSIHAWNPKPSLEEIIDADLEARSKAAEFIS